MTDPSAIVTRPSTIFLCIPTPTTTSTDLYERCQRGKLPGWAILSGVSLFYAVLLYIVVFGRARRRAPGLDCWDIGEIVTEEENIP